MSMKRSFVALALVAFLFAACGDDESPQPGAEPSPDVSTAAPSEEPSAEPSPDEQETTSIELWYAIETDTPDGAGLFAVHRDVPSTQAIGRAALTAWLEGPTAEEEAAGIVGLVPEGAELLDLDISEGTATVDLSSEFEATGSGTFGEGLLLNQLAWTITQFPTVDRALLKIDGEFKEAYMSHGFVIDEDHPLKRKKSDPLAPIQVSSPSIGGTLRSGDMVEGTANVFEATVSLRLLDANGDVLFEGFTTATCGTGCRGDYSEAIDFEIDSEQQGVLEVFESSAKDGSDIHKVSIPVTLVP
jgi:hypothetical protein